MRPILNSSVYAARRHFAAPVLALVLVQALAFVSAHASVGVAQIAARDDRATVTVFYPSDASPRETGPGTFHQALAEDGPPLRGNGRLIVISHGSGGSPWVHADLARSLVEAGFIVAMPAHRGDNYLDNGHPGPQSWTRRPREVSLAIDAVGADARFAPLLDLQRVGVYGMSAGGHTVLSLAGGQWSPAGFLHHCQAHIAEDFPACVGLATRLDGGWLDPLRIWIALRVLAWRFGDATARVDTDARVAAAVAAVPLAADFDMQTLAHPRIPLGLVTAGRDRWLAPRFHGLRVLQVCATCEHIADLPAGGHGALLSPLPPGFTGLEGELLNDPPGFDRSQLPAVDRRITAFFIAHLLAAAH